MKAEALSLCVIVCMFGRQASVCGGFESIQVTPLVPAFHYLIWAAEQDGAITVGCEVISHNSFLRHTHSLSSVFLPLSLPFVFSPPFFFSFTVPSISLS